MTIEYYKAIYLVNHIKRLTAIEHCDPDSLFKWFDKGYIVTDEHTHYNCIVKFEKYHQARIRKTLLQKQRRALEAKTRTPRIKKPKSVKPRQSLWEILTNDIIIHNENDN